MSATQPVPEFSRFVDVDALDVDGVVLRLTATTDELAALALRYGIEGMQNLEATVRVRPTSGGEVRVDIDFFADVLQLCVVTLEPVAAQVRDKASLRFVRDETSADDMVEFDPAASDPPELLVGGAFDVGEIVAQYVSLGLDPYPRATDASLADILPGETAEVVEEEAGERRNPFAVLAGRVQRPAR